MGGVLAARPTAGGAMFKRTLFAGGTGVVPLAKPVNEAAPRPCYHGMGSAAPTGGCTARLRASGWPVAKPVFEKLSPFTVGSCAKPWEAA
eukprot:3893697-Prymnesium_polylepis.1